MWRKCEKPKSGKNVKNSRGNFLEKNVEKIGVEKTWINDLEEVKSMEKCECGKKRNKFPWKNITYLVVHCCVTLKWLLSGLLCNFIDIDVSSLACKESWCSNGRHTVVLCGQQRRQNCFHFMGLFPVYLFYK